MANCKANFLGEAEGHEVLCAIIMTDNPRDDWNKNIQKYELKVGYSTNDLDAFLKNIDYEYDSGYGGQEVFGFIWYKDGTWSERGEYDGSEWWEYKSCPEIPKELKSS